MITLNNYASIKGISKNKLKKGCDLLIILLILSSCASRHSSRVDPYGSELIELNHGNSNKIYLKIPRRTYYVQRQEGYSISPRLGGIDVRLGKDDLMPKYFDELLKIHSLCDFNIRLIGPKLLELEFVAFSIQVLVGKKELKLLSYEIENDWGERANLSQVLREMSLVKALSEPPPNDAQLIRYQKLLTAYILQNGLPQMPKDEWCYSESDASSIYGLVSVAEAVHQKLH